jgi:hypothetical protein
MASYSTDRRGLLKILGAIGATCAYPSPGDELYGQTAEHQHSVAGAGGPASSVPRYLGERDFRTISRIADLIIPRTSTPGAVDAAVPEYIDRVVGSNSEHQSLVADGLRWLDTQSGPFLELSEAQQLAILEPLCRAADEKTRAARNVKFFALIKSLTADGYFTSQVGLIEELGYRGNSALPEFPECTHEH